MAADPTAFVRVRGARENNLQDVNVDVPRDALVVFTGVSGSGKSSLAFGTIYAEAQRRYLESVAPYARRLFEQLAVPEVDSIDGLPPAIALQQQRGASSSRSSVGTITTLSNLLRMLYSRAGSYPKGQPLLAAEAFSPQTPEGACPRCQGMGRIYDATEASMVPDPSLSIRERAIAAWPTAWHGQSQRDVVVSLGFDIDLPWKKLPKQDRDWLLFTEDQPVVPVYAGFEAHEVRAAKKRKEEPSYQGTFTGARRYTLHTFSNSQSPHQRKRAARHLVHSLCPECQGKRLGKAALRVTFGKLDIAQMSELTLSDLGLVLAGAAGRSEVAARIIDDVAARLEILLDLGLGHLSLDRSAPSLSVGELQRLRLGTQVRSNLFGVVYVLDEPSAGLHPADTQALLRALERLKEAGNSLFVVEHELEVVRRADWVVDVGPGAGTAGGRVVYSGPLAGLRKARGSRTAECLFGPAAQPQQPRRPIGFLELTGVSRNNVDSLDVRLPLGVLCAVTGVSGSGKSSLVSQALVDLVRADLGHEPEVTEEDLPTLDSDETKGTGRIVGGLGAIGRLVEVDQKPIGRTPRSNLATYTGLFDRVRALFAATPLAKKRHYDAGRFSFNVKKGRCETCEGEGFVFVELLFLPGVFSPCPTCKGSRYNEKTLEVKYRERSIAQVLDMTVDEACTFFDDDAQLRRMLGVVGEVGLGYLRLGQPATELSGGEAQRVKLATELGRASRGTALYVLDEPTTGLHPSDVENLLLQLNKLVDAGHSVLVVEHDLTVIQAADWVIDMGPGAGRAGGRIVAQGTPSEVAKSGSPTGLYLRR